MIGSATRFRYLRLVRHGRGRVTCRYYAVRIYNIVLQNKALFFLQAKQPLHTAVLTGFHYLTINTVRRWYVRVLSIGRLYRRGREVRGRFPHDRYLYVEASENGLTRGVGLVSSRAISIWPRLQGPCGVGGVLGRRNYFSRLLFSRVSLQTHPACCKHKAALPHLRLYYCSTGIVLCDSLSAVSALSLMARAKRYRITHNRNL